MSSPLVLRIKELDIEMIPLSKPNINKKDFKYIKKVLNSNILTDGFFQNKVEKIIKRLIKSKYVALTQSCTSALEISALLINLKKNDEVILPSYGFVSVANAIVLRGAKPVFVDVDEKNLNISIDDIKNKIILHNCNIKYTTNTHKNMKDIRP